VVGAGDDLTMDDMRYKRLEIARYLAMSGQYSKSLEIIRNLLGKYTDDIEVLRLMGNVIESCIYSNSDPNFLICSLDEAKSCYERIIYLDRANVFARIDIADLLFECGEKKEALQRYREALELSDRMDVDDVEHIEARIADLSNPE
jgi:tetratricopeptide (TPR) repeat protein